MASSGSGAVLSDLGLSEGQHTITLTAANSTGRTTSVSISVLVRSPCVELPAGRAQVTIFLKIGSYDAIF